jgi:rhodanese-related sulfurtransferase
MLKDTWKVMSKVTTDETLDWIFESSENDDVVILVTAPNEFDAWKKLDKLLGANAPKLEEDEVQNIADLLFREISLSMNDLKKYTQIVTEYLLTPNYINESTSYEQALNCVKMFNIRTDDYNRLFEKMKSLGAK